ncbi:hypothetical protein [Streptomyces meridianus]|nr:hypothetical protein [Streptomyces meridianus]
MSEHEWQALTKSEEAFMVNSYEIDILVVSGEISTMPISPGP